MPKVVNAQDEKYIYIFIRQDLPVSHQIVQSNHATYHMASCYGCDGGIPNIVLIGVPDTKALAKVQLKLKDNKIPHFVWNEPDYDFGFTAIATGPISGIQRQALKNYRLYSPTERQQCRAVVLDDNRGANLPTTSSTSEQLILNQLDAGGSPA